MYTTERYVYFMIFEYMKAQALYWKNIKLGEILLEVPVFSVCLKRSVLVSALLDISRELNNVLEVVLLCIATFYRSGNSQQWGCVLHYI